MPWFKSKQLPTTSYGYQPPQDATAKGWHCPECGRSEWETVGRWPFICECGVATNPIFNEPWAHDARGIELKWNMAHGDEIDGGYSRSQWPGWYYKDSALRNNTPGMSEARGQAKEISQRMAQDSWWIPGNVWFPLVWNELEANDLDSAAQDVDYWLSASSSEDVENDNSTRTNCRQVIDMVLRFESKPGANHHSLWLKIRSDCLDLAAGAYSALNSELQAGVNRIARETG
jgi:hypothetical protein